MLPFLCFRRIYRIRETFYFNGCTLPGRFIWISEFAVSAFRRTEFWLFSAIGFFNRNSHSCNGEQSREKWEETAASWRRGCTHLVTGDLRFRINIHQNKPVSQLHPGAVCSDFYTIVNRWCASLNYSVVPIFNSQSAYALFTQNTHKKMTAILLLNH